VKIQMPAWLAAVEPADQPAERTRFLLRLAALYVDPQGRLSELSRLCGLADNTLATVSKRQDKISPEIAVAVETAVGRDILPRELLRPDLFSVQG
jgi:hypothetical protein